MNATILDLRYKMKRVLGALEHGEAVQVLYHGKVKGVIMPLVKSGVLARDHAFFGSQKGGNRRKMAKEVEATMASLRDGRFRDL